MSSFSGNCNDDDSKIRVIPPSHSLHYHFKIDDGDKQETEQHKAFIHVI